MGRNVCFSSMTGMQDSCQCELFLLHNLIFVKLVSDCLPSSSPSSSSSVYATITESCLQICCCLLICPSF